MEGAETVSGAAPPPGTGSSKPLAISGRCLAKKEQLSRVSGRLLECQDRDLTWTVLYVPDSLSGRGGRCHQVSTDTIYEVISLRKSTSPQNLELIILISNGKQ